MRQEVMRKQQEAKEEKARKEIEKRESIQQEIKRKSLEAEERLAQQQQSMAKPKLTPLVSPASLLPQRFGPKTFSPVSNILALQRAKEKVEQLKAQKMSIHQQLLPQKTVAQTAPKGSGRVAHATKDPPQVITFTWFIFFVLISMHNCPN